MRESLVATESTLRYEAHKQGGTMNGFLVRVVKAEISLREGLTLAHKNFYARLRDERGDVPGWVLVVLMTTGLVTAIWTIAAPRLTTILKNSLDAMNGIR